MEQNHLQPPDRKTAFFSMLSITAGILALFACMSPPLQLLCGAMALMMAYISKNRHSMSAPAIIGSLMGFWGIFCSFLVLGLYVMTIRMLDDPSYVAMHREFMRQYQDLINAFSFK
ncbi:MAG: hypothetical protein HFG61_01225 [Lachnospiraceae bacterium]|nr:hypothetical protein [Lachnospiraceae bacterium]